MKLTASRRWLIWAAVLIATLWLVRQVEEPEQDDATVVDVVVRPVQPTADAKELARKGKAGRVESLNWDALGRRSAGRGKEHDLFGSHSWYVAPPPKPAQEAVSAKPVAPPVPFVYLGKLEDTPYGTLVFLSAGSKVYTVALGESIDRSWRLDGEDANAFRLTYLPLDLPQTLAKSAKPQLPETNHNQGVPG